MMGSNLADTFRGPHSLQRTYEMLIKSVRGTVPPANGAKQTWTALHFASLAAITRITITNYSTFTLQCKLLFVLACDAL